jgi:DNA repair protein RecN (Recombination protein N)
MLERLEVRGLGIIDRVELELADGFTVLTGETGAGKSLLVESLKLLSGQRAQTDLVRTGDERLVVEGCFRVARDGELEPALAELGVASEGELAVRRELTEGGRGRCWLNDVSVTAGALQAIAPLLLAIHGQHEQHGLAEPEVQRSLVDHYGGHGRLQEVVVAAHRRWAAAAAEVDRLRAASARRRDRLDAISFQLQEIDGLDPRIGEDDELRQRRALLRHAARLGELSAGVLAALTDDDGAAVGGLARAERGLDAIADCGLELAGAAERLAEARVHAEEVARELRDLLAGAEEDPVELETVETRLHRLETLMLKYGSSLEQVLVHRQALLDERAELESVADRLEAAVGEAAAALAAFDEAARELEAARRQAGDELAAAIAAVLAVLRMSGTTLRFDWQARPDAGSPLERDGVRVAFDSDGVEGCTLLIAANPGEEPRPMARVASGGELSRIHLALRTVLLGRRQGRGLTLLFDEVDTGLGGETAAALAGLLADLALEHQVLVVTHLPQVAARAGGHLRIEKVLNEGRAVTRATVLGREERELELARMLAGGTLTPSAHAHARALLDDR